MKNTKILTTLIISCFIFTSYNAYSQELSDNPWAVQNSNSAIENAYQKRRKSRIIKNKELQNSSHLDTTSAYKSKQEEKEEGFIDGIKNFFNEDQANDTHTQPSAQDITQSQIKQRRKSLSKGRISSKRRGYALPQKSRHGSFRKRTKHYSFRWSETACSNRKSTVYGS